PPVRRPPPGRWPALRRGPAQPRTECVTDLPGAGSAPGTLPAAAPRRPPAAAAPRCRPGRGPAPGRRSGAGGAGGRTRRRAARPGASAAAGRPAPAGPATGCCPPGWGWGRRRPAGSWLVLQPDLLRHAVEGAGQLLAHALHGPTHLGSDVGPAVA